MMILFDWLYGERLQDERGPKGRRGKNGAEDGDGDEDGANMKEEIREDLLLLVS